MTVSYKNFHTLNSKGSTMSNTTIKVGDKFVGGTDRSFRELTVIADITRDRGSRFWRCSGTRHNGQSHIAGLYETTLLTKYTRKSTQDFNVNTESYQRGFGIDIPAVPTALIRNAHSVADFIDEQTSTLLHVKLTSNVVRQAKGRDAKVQLLLDATDGYMLLAVPGVHSMDVFFVDSRDEALEALGMRKSAPVKTVTDALGNTWVAA